MLPLGVSSDTPHDHVVVRFVSWVLYVHIPEQTAVFPDIVIFPGPHINCLTVTVCESLLGKIH